MSIVGIEGEARGGPLIVVGLEGETFQGANRLWSCLAGYLFGGGRCGGSDTCSC